MSVTTAPPRRPTNTRPAVQSGGQAPKAPVPIAGDLRTSALLLAGLAIAVGSLHAVLGGVAWWLTTFIVMFLVFAAAATARSLSGMRWAGTLAGLLIGGLTITLVFASNTAILGFIPTLDTLRAFVELADQGAESITVQGIPADATQGILFVLCWPVALAAVAMDAVAIWWRAPALAGIPLLVIVTVPSVIRSEFTDPFFFALLAIVYLLLLRPRFSRIQAGLAAGLGALVVLGSLTLPLVLPRVDPAADSGLAGSVAAGINPIIDLGKDLRRGDTTLALTYSTTSSEGLYLRLTTLDNFVGEQWAPASVRPIPENTVDAFGTPQGLLQSVETEDVVSKVTIENAVGRWLPVPYPATAITGLTGTWSWEPDGLSVRTIDSNMRGQVYDVSSLDVEPTSNQLEAAIDSSRNSLAQVPDGLDPIVASTAADVTAGAATDYEKAVALQDWFRGSDFEYSESAPVTEGYDGSGLDVIPQFLVAKSGYCVHFASTMAVMARTLGIPSRVAVGFLPGTPIQSVDDDTVSYNVTSRELHAWPELYFAGVGWQRFEPTPGRGIVPDFPSTPVDDPETPDVDESQPSATPEPTSSSTADPDLAPEDVNPEAAAAAGADATTPSLALLISLLGLLIAASPAIARSAIRSRRMAQARRGETPAAVAWVEITDTARDLGFDVSSASTPRELVATLVTRVGLDDAATGQLGLLLTAVEAEVFGRNDAGQGAVAGQGASAGTAPGGETVRVGGVRSVLRALRRRAPWARRARATFAPVTLLDGIMTALASRRA